MGCLGFFVVPGEIATRVSSTKRRFYGEKIFPLFKKLASLRRTLRPNYQLLCYLHFSLSRLFSRKQNYINMFHLQAIKHFRKQVVFS